MMLGISVTEKKLENANLDGLCLELSLQSPQVPGPFAQYAEQKPRVHLPPDAMYRGVPDLDHEIYNRARSIVVHPCTTYSMHSFTERLLSLAQKANCPVQVENGVPRPKRGCREAYSNPEELARLVRCIGTDNVQMLLDVGKAALFHAMDGGYSTDVLETFIKQNSDIIAAYHICEKSYPGGAESVVGIREKGFIGTLELLPCMRGTVIIEANQPLARAYEDAKWLKNQRL